MVADERPISEVDVAFEVFPPRVLDGRLVCQDQDLGPTHLLGELVGRESLAKTHFRIPQEMRFAALPLLAAEKMKRLIDCSFLLRAHAEGLIPDFAQLLAIGNDPHSTL